MTDTVSGANMTVRSVEPDASDVSTTAESPHALPRVSVTMPAYNAALTLPRAIASLLLQKFQDWELILVDDGSTDHTEALVRDIPDARIRYLRLPTNQGRGVARQHALNLVRGEYMAMLDADDWLYSGHLSRLVDAIATDERLALVSAGLCIVDQHERLVGVRAAAAPGEAGTVRGPLTRLGPPPVAFPSSLIRSSVARMASFDPRLKLAQDVDFLLQVMMRRHYSVLDTHSYVYTEHATISADADKVMRALRYSRITFRKYRCDYPFASRRNEWVAMGKELVYKVGFASGQRQRLIERRSKPPTPNQIDEYRRQFAEVERATQRLLSRTATNPETTP